MPTANPPLDFSLKTLDAKHPSLLDLGLEAATLEYFGAGYCAKGLMKAGSRPRSITARGKLVAYAGLALDAATTPRYLFPPKFHPGLEVFNRDCFAEAEGPSTSRPRSRASCGSPSLASSPCSASSTGRSPKPRRRRKLRSSRPHAPDLPTPLGNPLPPCRRPPRITRSSHSRDDGEAIYPLGSEGKTSVPPYLPRRAS
jgi:hypothetical protein